MSFNLVKFRNPIHSVISEKKISLRISYFFLMEMNSKPRYLCSFWKEGFLLSFCAFLISHFNYEKYMLETVLQL